jgi:high-affinity iron transporter
MVALLAVFREGAEVALFLRMIAASSGDAVNALVAGPAAGFALLVIVFAALQIFSRRISMRALFLFTSASLFILGVKFVGESFALLQQAGVLSATPISHSATMREIGLNPSWEAVLAQTMVVALALTGLVSFKRSTVEASRDTR